MPEQIKKTRQTRTSTEPVAETSSTTGAQSKTMAADLDSLLDEIDEVLEANAEEFVKSYVQKGGQ
jgi:prokaryotic ubiquitin-like protein Pup